MFGVGHEFKGALTLSGPAERFNKEQLQAASALLLKRAAQATSLLGGDTLELQAARERLED